MTTCEAVALSLREQAHLPEERCCSIPTGVDPAAIDQGLTSTFPKPSPFVIGTVLDFSVLEGTKNISRSFFSFEDHPEISLLILGDGSMRPLLEKQAESLGLTHR